MQRLLVIFSTCGCLSHISRFVKENHKKVAIQNICHIYNDMGLLWKIILLKSECHANDPLLLPLGAWRPRKWLPV